MFFFPLQHCVAVNHTSRRQRGFDSSLFQLNGSQSLVDITAIRDSANNGTAQNGNSFLQGHARSDKKDLTRHDSFVNNL